MTTAINLKTSGTAIISFSSDSLVSHLASSYLQVLKGAVCNLRAQSEKTIEIVTELEFLSRAGEQKMFSVNTAYSLELMLRVIFQGV